MLLTGITAQKDFIRGEVKLPVVKIIKVRSSLLEHTIPDGPGFDEFGVCESHCPLNGLVHRVVPRMEWR